MTLQPNRRPRNGRNNNSHELNGSCPPSGPKNRISAHIDQSDPTPEAVPFSFRIMPLAAYLLTVHPAFFTTERALFVKADGSTIYAQNRGDFHESRWLTVDNVPEGLECFYFDFSETGDWYIGTHEAIDEMKRLDKAGHDLYRETMSFLEGGAA